jgi:hypothetical protein
MVVFPFNDSEGMKAHLERRRREAEAHTVEEVEKLMERAQANSATQRTEENP